MPLTDKQIKAAQTDSKDIFLLDGRGLYLRVRSSGLKTWLYRYKNEGKTKWLEIGVYPTVSLATARLEAHQAKAQRKIGSDPVTKKKIQISAEKALTIKTNNRLNISELFTRWEKLDLCNRKDKGQEIRRMFEKDILPIIGKMPAEDVKKAHIVKIIDLILERNANRMAKMMLGLLRQMFRFAQDKDIVEVDPTALIRKAKIGKPDVERDRALNQAELKVLFKKITTANLNLSTQLGLLITLSTGVRIGELLKAEWKNIDLKKKIWVIPTEDSKNGISLTIYLSNFSCKHFKSLLSINGTSRWCYPNTENNGHVSVKTITKQVSDRQLEDGATPLKNRSKNSTGLKLPGGKWTPHDLRRTAATLMTALGVSPDIADRCLNHKEPNRIRRTYQQHSYEVEKKAAWTILGESLDTLNKSIKGTK